MTWLVGKSCAGSGGECRPLSKEWNRWWNRGHNRETDIKSFSSFQIFFHFLRFTISLAYVFFLFWSFFFLFFYLTLSCPLSLFTYLSVYLPHFLIRPLVLLRISLYKQLLITSSLTSDSTFTKGTFQRANYRM